jgi:hypothetical protein
MSDEETVKLEIRENIEKASAVERLVMIDELYEKWVLNYEKVIERINPKKEPKDHKDQKDQKISLKKKYGSVPTIIDFLKIALINFELDLNTLQPGSFEKARYYVLTKLAYLRVFFDLYTELEDESIRPEIITKFGKISRAIINAEQAIAKVIHLQSSMLDTDIGESEQLDITKYSTIDTSNNTPYQNLLLFLLEKLMREGYRRYQGDCYRRIYTEKGFDTHSWEKAMSLTEFIMKVVRKEFHYEMWQNLTNGKDNLKAAVKILEIYEGGEFEEIKKDRHVFAFENGIYITKRWCDSIDKEVHAGLPYKSGYLDEFIPYEGPNTKKIGTSVVASKYFKMNFPDMFSTNPNGPPVIDWFKIIQEKCPNFRSIMTYQEWDEDVQKWLCILIGRCLYDVGELDGWQIMSYLLGQAGTGKSTILTKIVKMLYEDVDVGTINNNMEVKFGLGALYKKLLMIGPEIKTNFSMEQSEFQSMISGEDIQIAEKHKTAHSIVWHVPGMLAGNEVPNYKDAAGSISRRLLVFMFNKKVRKGDTQLGRKLEKELPYIILACNRGYLDAINRYGSSDIWEITPEYFKISQKEMADSTNALTHFLHSDKVKIGKDLYVREKDFIDCFNEHCQEINMTKARWSKQYYQGPFDEYKLVIVKEKKKYPNRPGGSWYTGNFVVGVDIAIMHTSEKNEE